MDNQYPWDSRQRYEVEPEMFTEWTITEDSRVRMSTHQGWIEAAATVEVRQ